MSPSIEHLLTSDVLSPDELVAIRAAIAQDPALQREVRTWMEVSSRLGHVLDEQVADADALVLHALHRRGRHMDLTTQERARVLASAQDLDAAITRHPSLELILNRVADDARAFDQIWTDRFRTRGSNLRLIRRSLAVAATVIALFAVVFLLQLGGGDSVEEAVTLVTAENEVRPLDLDDGTQVRLMGNSTLVISGDEPRNVTLTGSAFFDVAPSPTSFLIETDHATLQVLGTSFGVRALDAYTEVVIAAGRVSLRSARADAEAVVLSRGQRSRVMMGQAPTPPETIDVSSALGWTGLFIFRETPLAQVVKAVGDSFHVQIRIADDLDGEELTGTFEKEQGAEEILRVVAAALGARIDIVEAGKSYVIRRQG